MRLTGSLIVPVTAMYVFWLSARDGARAWLDGAPLLDNAPAGGCLGGGGGLAAATTRSAWPQVGPAVRRLRAGVRHELRVEYYQGPALPPAAANATTIAYPFGMLLEMATPTAGVPRQPVPDASLVMPAAESGFSQCVDRPARFVAGGGAGCIGQPDAPRGRDLPNIFSPAYPQPARPVSSGCGGDSCSAPPRDPQASDPWPGAAELTGFYPPFQPLGYRLN